MISPIDNSGFKHELKFYDFDRDWYEIAEPIGFDSAKFVMKQERMWARDLTYFAIDGLTFPKAKGLLIETAQQVNPQGDFYNRLDYGLFWLLENRRIKGSEMKVGYRVSVNGVVFREFELDTRDDSLTDGKTYFKCKLIEIGLVADHKRNLKNTFDAFSDKNVKDEAITPIESFSYLAKAIPLVRKATFKTPSEFSFDFINTPTFGNFTGINPSQQLANEGLSNPLGWLSPQVNTNEYLDFGAFGLFQAVVSTTAVTVTVDIDMDYEFLNGGGSLVGAGSIGLYLYVGSDVSIGNLRQTFFYDSVSPSQNASGTINQTFTFEIDEVEVSKKVFLFIYSRGVGDRRIKGVIRKQTITVDATEKEIDIVIPAVTYENLVIQSGKFVNDLPIDSQVTTFGGCLYNQAIFNRASIGNRKEMFTTPEKVYSQLEEVCADIEFSQEKIQIRHRLGFYENVEIASFLVIPSDEYSEPFNETYLINNYQFGYKNFEQEKTEKGTSRAVHTQSEWLPRNERREDEKKIEIDFIRDPTYRQTTFNLEIKSPSTSTDRDEKLFIEDMTRIAPNTVAVWTRTLLMRWTSGKLEILNRNTLGTSEDAVLNWNVLGLVVGSNFQILSGQSVGSYTVFSISDKGDIITLTPIGTIPNFTGNATIKVQYSYANVEWMTRTNEGFSIAPTAFANLRYTIKRNIFEWYDYLATVVTYAKKDIKNSFFKNFGKLETQLTTETQPVIEDATILYSDLPQPRVEPILIKSEIVAPYSDIVDYLQAYKEVKGFVRLYDIDGNVRRVYPSMLEYSIATAGANIEGEKKFEDAFLRIDIANDIVTVNDAPYDLSGVANWFIVKNDYIQLYDEKSNPLSNFYKYDFVILNGYKYDSIIELVTALNLYSWI